VEDSVALSRGAKVVIVLLVFACFVSIGGMLAIWLMVGAEPSVPSKSTFVLRIDGDPVEGGPDDTISQLLPVQRPRSVWALVMNIRKAKADRRVAALVVRPTGLASPYLAKVQELREAILDFRRSGKPAVAYLEDGGQTEYYLATACDRIFLAPSSALQLTGMANYEIFLRGTLDKIGAVPDMLHIGAYKTAPNQLTEKTFTPAHREMAESLNTDSFDQLVKAIADGRKRSEADVRALLDQGPFLAEAALRAGLIDDVAYEDQLGDKAKIPLGKGKRLDLDTYDRVAPDSLGLDTGPRIAVIYASGTIVSGRSGYDPLNGAVLGSDTLVDNIRRVREAKDIRGVVLRIDSPGGSAVASDVLWRELVLMRDSKPEKPFVVSMSDLAASGGYYIAMAAPQIVAEPGTLTGSIGIFGGKVVTGGVFNKLGANIEGVSRGANADMNSPTRPYSPSERAKVGEQLQAFYDQFVERVAASRHMTPERVDAIAQGRVWTGRQAKENGLVDALGGLERAIELVKQKAKLAGREVEVVVYPARKSLYEILSSQWGGSDERVRLAALLGVTERRAVGIATAPWTLFRDGEALALMPFGLVR
jgi:protease IV